MDPDFWHARWADNQIGFHRPDVNPALLQFWPRLELAGHGRILVPLCGKSLDMLWLREQGYRVAGIELSSLALEAFCEEHGLHPEIRRKDRCSHWSVDGIDLYCGDFFQLGAPDIGPVDACYDRAALVALPAPMRHAYVRHLLGLLPAGACGLLVTLDYDQSGMDGPPFAVPDPEVRKLFTTGCELERLQHGDALADNPGLARRGLGALRESVWLLRKS